MRLPGEPESARARHDLLISHDNHHCYTHFGRWFQTRSSSFASSAHVLWWYSLFFLICRPQHRRRPVSVFEPHRFEQMIVIPGWWWWWLPNIMVPCYRTERKKWRLRKLRIATGAAVGARVHWRTPPRLCSLGVCVFAVCKVRSPRFKAKCVPDPLIFLSSSSSSSSSSLLFTLFLFSKHLRRLLNLFVCFVFIDSALSLSLSLSLFVQTRALLTSIITVRTVLTKQTSLNISRNYEQD